MPRLLCGVLAVVLLWLLYELLDQAVTLDHRSQQAAFLERQRDVLLHVAGALSPGAPEVRVRELLGQVAADSMFEKAPGVVVAGQVTFVFQDGRLARVTLGESETER